MRFEKERKEKDIVERQERRVLPGLFFPDESRR